MKPPSAEAVVAALSDLREVGVPWALVGGLALQAYGVPRTTLDADALVREEDLLSVATRLVEEHGWKPLRYDQETGEYEEVDEPREHEMDDPVLFSTGAQRTMIPLTILDLTVELLAAQHPVESEMLDTAGIRRVSGVRVPVAPLGGILLVKTIADRGKDRAAIEQSAEHLPKTVLAEALDWADERDPDNAEDLRALVAATRARRGLRPKKG